MRLLRALEVPALDHYLGLLAGQPDPDGTAGAVFLGDHDPARSRWAPARRRCSRRASTGCARAREFPREYRTALELGRAVPGRPGGARRTAAQPHHPAARRRRCTCPAGNLHAYLAGVGIEIMANSDNVLRGGLTPKHVDVPELMRVLDFSAGDVPVLHGRRGRTGRMGVSDADDRVPAVAVRAGGRSRRPPTPGPQVLLTVDGEHRGSVRGGRAVDRAARSVGVDRRRRRPRRGSAGPAPSSGRPTGWRSRGADLRSTRAELGAARCRPSLSDLPGTSRAGSHTREYRAARAFLAVRLRAGAHR